MISDSAREEAEGLLRNWSTFFADSQKPPLWYTELPTSRDYVAPKGEKPLPRQSANKRDADVANAAILSMNLKDWPRDDHPSGFFSASQFIWLHWGNRIPMQEIRDFYGCATSTVYDRRNRAIDAFWHEYRNILRGIEEISK